MTLGEYASGKNVLFYIKDVPVLYLPYMLFPLRRERQSGFLIPVIGTSTITGTNVSVPFYWAISPSQDVTFNLKYMSKRGVGAGADYQYIRKTGSEGSFKGFLIYDTKQERFRGEFSERHQEAFSPSITFKSDFSYVSDRNYYRDFTETFGDYNRKSVDSNIFMTKRWQRFSLTPELRLSQNLEATSNADTLQKLPLITFTAVKQRFGAIPFYFSLDSNFTNFYRERGVSGQRVDLHPRATFYYTPVEEVETAAWVGFRSRLYNTGEGGNIAVFRESGLMDGGFTVSSTLARVYEIGWKDLRKVQHVIMPEVGYSYLAKGDQSSLPFFDYNDRVVAQNMATYSITNYLTGKFVSGDETSDYRTLAYLKLSQGYDFSGSRRDLLTAYQDLDPFSDIRIEAQIKPLKHLSFMTDSRYNPNRTNFSSTEVAVNVADDKGNLVSAGYHFTRTQFEYLEGKVSVALLKPFLLNFNGRYSVDSGSMLESYYSIEYKQQCWGIIFSYGERRGNRNFFVNFTMAGLGPLAKIKAF